MPSNLVKTKIDEKLWKEAKKRAAEQDKTGNWKYVTAIFEKLKAAQVKKSTNNYLKHYD